MNLSYTVYNKPGKIMTVFRKSIRYELTKYIVISMFFFLTAVLIFSFQFIGRFFEKTAEEQAMTILHETDSKINNFFREIEYLSESLVNYSAVYEVRVPEMKELFITNVLARKRYLRAVYLGTDNGKMYEWGYGEGFIDYTPSFPEGYTPVVRPWYIKGVESGTHVITDPYIYASINRLGITSVNPVYNRGEFVGVLGIDVMLESMRDFLDDLDIPKNGRCILMTGTGRIIASQLDSLSPGEAEGLKSIIYNKLDSISYEKEGSFTGSFNGNSYFYAFEKNDLTGWNLSIVYPYDSITAGISRTITIISAVYLALVILLSAALANLSRVLIIKPLEALFSVMKKIEMGDRSVRVSINSSNEFAMIGDQFNRLFGIIEEYSESLERKVEERTSEVIKLQKENTRLRIIEEKERILQDLHDSIGAKLTNINICNNVLLAGKDIDFPERREEMYSRISDNCNTAIRELREITVSDSSSFSGNLSDYLEYRIGKRLELKNISFRIKWKIRRDSFYDQITGTADRELLNIFKELVSNVLKHSDADRVFLTVGGEHGRIIMVFSDNGKGGAAGDLPLTGNGIKNIRNRMNNIDGTAVFEIRKNRGLKVILKFPPAGRQEK